jgi:hypothetical protein
LVRDFRFHDRPIIASIRVESRPTNFVHGPCYKTLKHTQTSSCLSLSLLFCLITYSCFFFFSRTVNWNLFHISHTKNIIFVSFFTADLISFLSSFEHDLRKLKKYYFFKRFMVLDVHSSIQYNIQAIKPYNLWPVDRGSYIELMVPAGFCIDKVISEMGP